MATLQAYELFAWLLVVLGSLLLFRRQLAPPKKIAGAPTPSPLPRPRGLPLVGNRRWWSPPPPRRAPRSSATATPCRGGRRCTRPPGSPTACRTSRSRRRAARSGAPRDARACPSSSARRACAGSAIDVREGEAAKLVAAIASAAASGGGSPVNLTDMVVAASNRIVRRVAFGDDGGEESIRTRAVLEETQRLLGAFWVADFVPWLGWVDALRGLRRRLERNLHDLDAFYESVIDDHLRKPASSEEEEDLVDVLLRLHRDPAHRSTFGCRSQIKGILTDMFIAGTDTSAAAVEWTMTELVNHPGVLAKAQREVRGGGGGGDMVREADLPRLRYLKLVIRESLRLHPPAPLLVPREATEPCTVEGHEIPAGTRVLVNAKAIGVDPAAWGADAARFVPERHDGGAGEGAGLDGFKPWYDGFELVPFGIGRRSCPGVHFATAVVELVLANLLFSFDWRAPLGGAVDVEKVAGLTVHRKNPLVLVAERTEGACGDTVTVISSTCPKEGRSANMING